MTFNYEGTIFWGFQTEFKIGNFVLRNDSGIFGISVLWIFGC